jgi:hypothetical protein
LEILNYLASGCPAEHPEERTIVGLVDWWDTVPLFGKTRLFLSYNSTLNFFSAAKSRYPHVRRKYPSHSQDSISVTVTKSFYFSILKEIGFVSYTLSSSLFSIFLFYFLKSLKGSLGSFVVRTINIKTTTKRIK